MQSFCGRIWIWSFCESALAFETRCCAPRTKIKGAALHGWSHAAPVSSTLASRLPGEAFYEHLLDAGLRARMSVSRSCSAVTPGPQHLVFFVYDARPGRISSVARCRLLLDQIVSQLPTDWRSCVSAEYGSMHTMNFRRFGQRAKRSVRLPCWMRKRVRFQQVLTKRRAGCPCEFVANLREALFFFPLDPLERKAYRR